LITDLECILCPNGCSMRVRHQNKEIIDVENIKCEKGYDYAVQELSAPVRTLTSTVKVIDGELPLVSVRTDKPIPVELIFKTMECIRDIEVRAPVKVGQKLVENLFNTGVALMATREVERII